MSEASKLPNQAEQPHLPQADMQPIDDCWNRIGSQGDKTCPLLVEHIHCRNCSVYAAAATRLLDRYALDRSVVEVGQYAANSDTKAVTRSMLIFRLGEEWLGLPTRCLVEVAPLQVIHSLPHQRSRALLGVANVRGALVACLALGELLGIDCTVPRLEGQRITPRMVILAAQGGPVIAAVDEVDGIHAIDEQLFLHSSAPVGHLLGQVQAASRLTQSVLQWRQRSVRCLDAHELMLAVARSLT